MTKIELLAEINLALDNDACLLLKAGDYFTDYVKIVTPHTMRNFLDEVDCFGTDAEEQYDEIPYVAIHSVDIREGTRERNEYYIYNAKAVVTEELKALLSLVDFKV